MFGTHRVEIAVIFVKAPLPDVASHVVEVIAVRRETSNRRCPRPPILAASASKVGIVLCDCIACRVTFASEIAAGSVFPLRLRWQPFLCPLCISDSITPRHSHNGKIRCIKPRIVPERRFRIPRRFDKCPIARVRHLIDIHVKRVKRDGMDRLFIAIAGIGAHQKCAGGDEHHCCAINWRDNLRGRHVRVSHASAEKNTEDAECNFHNFNATCCAVSTIHACSRS